MQPDLGRGDEEPAVVRGAEADAGRLRCRQWNDAMQRAVGLIAADAGAAPHSHPQPFGVVHGHTVGRTFVRRNLDEDIAARQRPGRVHSVPVDAARR